jgi:hypothetical protein
MRIKKPGQAGPMSAISKSSPAAVMQLFLSMNFQAMASCAALMTVINGAPFAQNECKNRLPPPLNRFNLSGLARQTDCLNQAMR